MQETDSIISRYKYLGSKNVGNIFRCASVARCRNFDKLGSSPRNVTRKNFDKPRTVDAALSRRNFGSGDFPRGGNRTSRGRIDSGNLFVSRRVERNRVENAAGTNWAVLISGKWMLHLQSRRRLILSVPYAPGENAPSPRATAQLELSAGEKRRSYNRILYPRSFLQIFAVQPAIRRAGCGGIKARGYIR